MDNIQPFRRPLTSGSRMPAVTAPERALSCAMHGAIQASGESDEARGTLERLSWLPDELQDAVLRYLPLADILVWQTLNRNFRHRVRLARLREWAVCHSLGTRLCRAAFTQASLSSGCVPGWPGAVFHADVHCCALMRTLKETRRLALGRTCALYWPDAILSGMAAGTGRRVLIWPALLYDAGILRQRRMASIWWF